MPSKNTLKRLEWFKKGVEALAYARPDAPRLYCCPICLRGFDNPNILTIEDVPPKSIGGKPLVLTCGVCNNRSGHLLDAHIKTGRDLREIAQGKRDTRIRFGMDGHTITANALFRPGGIYITGVPENSDPHAHRSLFAKLNEVAATGSKDWKFSIELIVRHNPWREAVGWLRVAYLYAFAALGYNFILRPELNIIREQFQKPNDRIVPQAMKHTGSPSGNGLSFVYSPTELRGIIVRLDVNLFFFPAYVEASTLYDRLASYPSTGQKLTMSGIHIDLPKRPLFEFDYHPSLMLLTVPPEERPPQLTQR
jgi:hypothetical protein